MGYFLPSDVVVFLRIDCCFSYSSSRHRWFNDGHFVRNWIQRPGNVACATTSANWNCGSWKRSGSLIIIFLFLCFVYGWKWIGDFSAMAPLWRTFENGVRFSGSFREFHGGQTGPFCMESRSNSICIPIWLKFMRKLPQCLDVEGKGEGWGEKWWKALVTWCDATNQQTRETKERRQPAQLQFQKNTWWNTKGHMAKKKNDKRMVINGPNVIRNNSQLLKYPCIFIHHLNMRL